MPRASSKRWPSRRSNAAWYSTPSEKALRVIAGPFCRQVFEQSAINAAVGPAPQDAAGVDLEAAPEGVRQVGPEVVVAAGAAPEVAAADEAVAALEAAAVVAGSPEAAAAAAAGLAVPTAGAVALVAVEPGAAVDARPAAPEERPLAAPAAVLSAGSLAAGSAGR